MNRNEKEQINNQNRAETIEVQYKFSKHFQMQTNLCKFTENTLSRENS